MGLIEGLRGKGGKKGGRDREGESRELWGRRNGGREEGRRVREGGKNIGWGK